LALYVYRVSSLSVNKSLWVKLGTYVSATVLVQSAEKGQSMRV